MYWHIPSNLSPEQLNTAAQILRGEAESEEKEEEEGEEEEKEEEEEEEDKEGEEGGVQEQRDSGDLSSSDDGSTASRSEALAHLCRKRKAFRCDSTILSGSQQGKEGWRGSLFTTPQVLSELVCPPAPNPPSEKAPSQKGSGTAEWISGAWPGGRRAWCVSWG